MMQAILIKWAAILGIVLTVLAAVYIYGNSRGRDHVQNLWNEDKLEAASAAIEAVAQRLADNVAIEFKAAQTNQKIRSEYEKRIADLNARKPARLFMPKPAACGNTVTVPTDTAAPNGVDDTATHIELPGQTASNLHELAADAQVISVRLKSLQEYVTTTCK